MNFAETSNEWRKRGVERGGVCDDLGLPYARFVGTHLAPYWSPGLKELGPKPRAIIALAYVHNACACVPFILEGLGYSLREGAATSETYQDPHHRGPYRRGGSQSPAATQLTAVIFGLPAAKPHTYDSIRSGSAIDLRLVLKLHPDFDTQSSNDQHRGNL
jgi:sugar (pentulose or hexulose) kinase